MELEPSAKLIFSSGSFESLSNHSRDQSSTTTTQDNSNVRDVTTAPAQLRSYGLWNAVLRLACCSAARRGEDNHQQRPLFRPSSCNPNNSLVRRLPRCRRHNSNRNPVRPDLKRIQLPQPPLLACNSLPNRQCRQPTNIRPSNRYLWSWARLGILQPRLCGR